MATDGDYCDAIGADRAAIVVTTCGPEVILTVAESPPCHYTLSLSTPAVCAPPPSPAPPPPPPTPISAGWLVSGGIAYGYSYDGYAHHDDAYSVVLPSG